MSWPMSVLRNVTVPSNGAVTRSNIFNGFQPLHIGARGLDVRLFQG